MIIAMHAKHDNTVVKHTNKKSPANAKRNTQQWCMFEFWKPSKTKSVTRWCQM